jgi:DNA repair protein RadC
MSSDSNIPKRTIKDWSVDDRPREKLLLKGSAALSDAELMAILIGSGNSDESAVELCRRLLMDADNNLNRLATYDVSDLIKYKGIGEAKAITIMAAMDLGRRRASATPVMRPKCEDSEQVYQVIGHQLKDLPHEEFWLLLLNSRSQLIKKVNIGRGGINSVIADKRLIWKHAFAHLASSIVLVHNHPGGSCYPSSQDIKLTDQLVKSGEILGVKVIDHVIIAGNRYYSFSDENRIL